MNSFYFLGALDKIGFHFFQFHLLLLWQSSIVMLTVLIISYWVRKRQASFRCLLWIIALTALPCIPVLTFLFSLFETPQIAIPVMPYYETVQEEMYMQMYNSKRHEINSSLTLNRKFPLVKTDNLL